MDVGQISYLPGHLCPNGQLWFRSGDSLAELYIQLDGVAAGLQLTGDYPSADLINQCAEYAAVDRVHPSLLVGSWVPGTHDIVTILIELHVKSYRIVWATAETVVLRIVAPRVDNLLQHT